jgi:SAM-dependent methyltransferase
MKLECICGVKTLDPNFNSVVGYKDGVKIVMCGLCGLWYVPEIPDDYMDMYRDGSYHTAIQREIGHVPYSERYDHDYEIAEARLGRISRTKPEGTLLDAGCSNGAFVDKAMVFGYDPHGIDLFLPIPSPFLSQGTVYDINENFDIITLYDTIEHFDKPLLAFSHIYNHLNKNGLLVIDAPDFSCGEFREQGLAWKHVRPREHLYMIRPKRMIELLEIQGFVFESLIFPIPGKYELFMRKN